MKFGQMFAYEQNKTMWRSWT